jgi:hypothetical protein
MYSAGAQNPTMTDSNGQATIWLLDSVSAPYSIEVHPPEGSNYLLTTVKNITLGPDQSQTITMSIPVTVTGTLVDGHGVNPAGNVNIAVEDGVHGSVTNVIVTNGGSGYGAAPAVTFSKPGAGGMQATGTATVSGGVVTGVTVVNPGAGYTSAPTVTFSPLHTSATAAVAVAKITTAPAIAMTTTASDGTFSFVIPSGTHNLKISANPGNGQTGAAQTLALETVQGINFTQDTNLGTITLPEKQVTIHVQSAAAPITNLLGVKVSAQSSTCPQNGQLTSQPSGTLLRISAAGGAQSGLLNGLAVLGCSTYNAFAAGHVATDASGNATIWLLPSTMSALSDNYTLTAYPPAPATPQYLQGTHTNVPVTADLSGGLATFSLAHK